MSLENLFAIIITVAILWYTISTSNNTATENFNDKSEEEPYKVVEDNCECNYNNFYVVIITLAIIIFVLILLVTSNNNTFAQKNNILPAHTNNTTNVFTEGNRT